MFYMTICDRYLTFDGKIACTSRHSQLGKKNIPKKKKKTIAMKLYNIGINNYVECETAFVASLNIAVSHLNQTNFI